MSDTIKLVIEMEPNGQISVNGPVHNKALCYGLLESAKDAIRAYVERKNQSQIVQAPIDVLKNFNGNGKS